MEIKKTWRIGLSNKRDILTQYIVADSFDDAITKAQNTFDSRLYGLDAGKVCKAGQKYCNKTVINHPLRFGFCGGWTTVRPAAGHDTIDTMLAKAISQQCNKNGLNAAESGEITEIYWHEYL